MPDPTALALLDARPIEDGTSDPDFSYSMRLVRSLLRAIRPLGFVPREWEDALENLPLEGRLPVGIAHQMLSAVVEIGGDPDLGLKAVREWRPGDGGALDCAISSAATVRDALEAGMRYIALVNDAVTVHIETRDTDAFVRLHHRVSLPRQALDFELGALFRAFKSVWDSGPRPSLRVLVTTPAPDDTTEYTRTFDGVPMEFAAPFSGFAFDARFLDVRLVTAEFRLNEVIRRHADAMLQDLSSERNLAERVRAAVASELADGRAKAAHVARLFHMSPRTLERRLARQGTTFTLLLEDVRRQLAVRYVASGKAEPAEIALCLGFSHTTAFYRAFKRWTGETPQDYRRAHRPRTEPPGEPGHERAG
jgi:AraC-like DNA-binding protein